MALRYTCVLAENHFFTPSASTQLNSIVERGKLYACAFYEIISLIFARVHLAVE